MRDGRPFMAGRSSGRDARRAYHSPMRTFPRSLDRELLDAPDPDPVELRQNLGEMAMLNRLPGGVGSSVSAVLDLLDPEPGAAVLDVGTGSGDFARHLRRRSPAPLVLLDIN